jgi:hypothetical protein
LAEGGMNLFQHSVGDQMPFMDYCQSSWTINLCYTGNDLVSILFKFLPMGGHPGKQSLPERFYGATVLSRKIIPSVVIDLQ